MLGVGEGEEKNQSQQFPFRWLNYGNNSKMKAIQEPKSIGSMKQSTAKTKGKENDFFFSLLVPLWKKN